MTDRNPSGGSPVFALLIIAIAFAAMLLAGCTVGPGYSRPDVDLPRDYAIVQGSVPAPERWRALVNDPALDRLVDEALRPHRDLRASAERIEEARAQLVAGGAGRDAVRCTLIGDTVRVQFALQALDRRTEIAGRALVGWRKALELQKMRADAGVASELDYRQVESNIRTNEALL